MEPEHQSVLYTRSGEILTPKDYTRSLEQSWRQSIRGVPQLSDYEASRLYSVSATAYACTNYRARTQSEFPIGVADPSGRLMDGEWTPLTYFQQHSAVLIEFLSLSLLIWGRAYLLKHRNQYGFPTALQWVYPEDVIEYFDSITPSERLKPTGYTIDGVQYAPSEIVSFRLFSANRDQSGTSPYEVVLSQLSSDINISQHASAFFFNGARPDGMLLSKRKLTDDELDRARADWLKFKGAGNSHKTFVSSGEWEWVPITSAPQDLAMSDLRADVRRDVCVVFEVNPALIGVADVSDPLSAGSTRESIKTSYLQEVAIPWVEANILAPLNQQWAWVDFVDRDYYTLTVARNQIPALNLITSERIATSQTLFESNLGTLSEARALLDLPPLDDFIRHHPGPVSLMFADGVITSQEYRKMMGLPEAPAFNTIKIDGQTVPVSRVGELMDLKLKALEAPAPGLNLFSRSVPDTVSPPNAAALADPNDLIEQPSPALDVDSPEDYLYISFPARFKQVLKYCKREAAARLVYDVSQLVHWTAESAWQLPLIRVPSRAQSLEIKELLRTVDLTAFDEFKLTITEVATEGTSVVARLTPGPAYEQFQADMSWALSLTGLNYEFMPLSITLGVIDSEAVLQDLLIEVNYPLFVDELVLDYKDLPTRVYPIRSKIPAELKELRNWGSIVSRGRDFTFKVVDESVQKVLHFLRAFNVPIKDCVALGETLIKERSGPDVIRSFESVRGIDPDAYWQEFDDLFKEVGVEWIDNYSTTLYNKIEDALLQTGTLPADFNFPGLIEDTLGSWIGSAENPGPLLKIYLAGYHAGDLALTEEIPAALLTPIRAVFAEIDWDQVTTGAMELLYDRLTEQLTDVSATTRDIILEVFQAWENSGSPIDELLIQLKAALIETPRDIVIVKTEVSEIYNEAAFQRYESVGIDRATWHTVMDSLVCPLCQPLDKVSGDYRTGWIHPGGPGDSAKYQGEAVLPPAHPNCRCFTRPDMTSLMNGF